MYKFKYYKLLCGVELQKAYRFNTEKPKLLIPHIISIILEHYKADNIEKLHSYF